MEVPFTTEQFFSVIEQYNEAVWPVQVVLNLLAIAAIVLLIRNRSYSGRAISTVLALLWLWTALAYHELQDTHHLNFTVSYSAATHS